ncbi:MAG: hypothetical protein J6O50_15445 [Ruminiclostridium sp.]|nr:hypothetical protein [Ruminiclostridium sp.]
MFDRRNKALQITTVLVICLSVFCSFLFIAELADHECTHDDDCVVCHTIAICINTVRNTSVNAAALSAAFAAMILLLAVTLSAGTENNNDTLISLKVELRN